MTWSSILKFHAPRWSIETIRILHTREVALQDRQFFACSWIKNHFIKEIQQQIFRVSQFHDTMRNQFSNIPQNIRQRWKQDFIYHHKSRKSHFTLSTRYLVHQKEEWLSQILCRLQGTQSNVDQESLFSSSYSWFPWSRKRSPMLYTIGFTHDISSTQNCPGKWMENDV